MSVVMTIRQGSEFNPLSMISRGVRERERERLNDSKEEEDSVVSWIRNPAG